MGSEKLAGGRAVMRLFPSQGIPNSGYNLVFLRWSRDLFPSVLSFLLLCSLMKSLLGACCILQKAS